VAYLLPAGSAARTVNKFGLGVYRTRMMRSRGLGAVIMAANGNGAGGVRVPIKPILPPIRVFPIPVAPVTAKPPMPAPIPVAQCNPGDVMMANATWDATLCRWVPNPMPPAPPTPSTAGTPVPAGFPVNQMFVAPDGSVWEYSTSSNAWFNTGTPYSAPSSQPAPASTPVPAGYPTSAAYTDSNGNIWTWTGSQWAISGSVNTGGAMTPVTPPVSVTVAPTPAESTYQSILDWLTQATLVSPVPNWIVAVGVALLAMKVTGGGKR
jgi:hypothetical protein